MQKIVTPQFWSRLLTIIEIKHIRNNKVIWESSYLPNLLHTEGEEYILSLVFDGDFDIGNPSSKHVKDGDDKPIRPTDYYLGLDDRTTVSASDDMTIPVLSEPTANGYTRQSVNSETGFSVELLTEGYNRATTNVVRFEAIGGSWGPVSNLFITNKSDNSGYLVATAPLDDSRTLTDGDSLTMRLGLSLKDCP